MLNCRKITYHLDGLCYSKKIDDSNYHIEEYYIQHLDLDKLYLYEKKYFFRYNATYYLNNYLDNPGFIKYFCFTDKIQTIKYYENNLLSKRDGPAIINYDLDGNISSEEYIFEGKEFPCQYDLEKYVKKLNLK